MVRKGQSDRLTGAPLPPLQGHVFSLGSTLSAALDFVIEPELQAELGEEALRMLELMQAERPADRPRPQVHSRKLRPRIIPP